MASPGICGRQNRLRLHEYSSQKMLAVHQRLRSPKYIQSVEPTFSCSTYANWNKLPRSDSGEIFGHLGRGLVVGINGFPIWHDLSVYLPATRPK